MRTRQRENTPSLVASKSRGGAHHLPMADGVCTLAGTYNKKTLNPPEYFGNRSYFDVHYFSGYIERPGRL